MASVSMRELLEAGVHFGHQTRRWNPKMKRFIFTERGGIYIIDLQQTAELLEEAQDFARNLASRGGTILFVGTKKQAQDAVAEQAARVKHAVRQPALARRAADELAHDLRPHRSTCTSCAGCKEEGQLDLLPAKERISMARRAREARGQPRRRRRPAEAAGRASSSSTCARSSSPSARRAGSACRCSRSWTRTATPTRPTS